MTGAIADELWRADGQLLLAASVVCAAGLVLLVRRHFEEISPLSWFDAVIAASSIGALATAVGLPAPAVVAACGVAGSLALSRWRPGRPLLLGACGLALLGAGAVIVALPLLLAPLFWHQPRSRPVQFLSWPVLIAVVVSALLALGLLAIQDFVRIGGVAAGLAAITVLAGTARAAATVTDRLRESKRQALTDELTGLGNRRYLHDRLEASIAEAERNATQLALVLIDLDGFKELNDTLGHYAGDEVLRQIGPRLRKLLRREDTLARLGGDEFAIALAPGDEDSASIAALRLRGALERSFEVEEIALNIDASVGIALFPEHAPDAAGLLQRADVAMYQAKRLRSGYEFYLAARDHHSRRRLSLIGELHGAIIGEQLHVEYQPQVELATGNVRGVEALVRWAHPSLGLVEPEEFLPLAEQSRQTRALTEFVLNHALRAIGERRAAGFDLTVSVNLGPADLLHRDLPVDVTRLLDVHKIPAEVLKLEVSEHVVMADPERVAYVLLRLREVGVGISLDDFGTGHSSLAHLRQLTVDELKIDRSFVMRMLDDERDQAIVRSTIDLAHRLGLRACAEGVETEAALKLLADNACDDAQGYFIMRPVTEAMLDSWLRAINGSPAIPTTATRGLSGGACS